MSKPELKLDWCSYEAAKYACEKWHYSKTMPMPPIVKIGVWEAGAFIGCVLFSRGANNNLLKPYGLKFTEGCELTRVALSSHITPTSKILSIAISLLRKEFQPLRLIVSFADANEGHLGIIYQATNWLYSGKSKSTPKFKTKNGKILHQRQVSINGVKSQYGKLGQVPFSRECEIMPQLDKHRYLMPLDDGMRRQIQPLAKPYPKRATSIGSDATGNQSVEGSANLTVALQ